MVDADLVLQLGMAISLLPLLVHVHLHVLAVLPLLSSWFRVGCGVLMMMMCVQEVVLVLYTPFFPFGGVEVCGG